MPEVPPAEVGGVGTERKQKKAETAGHEADQLDVTLHPMPPSCHCHMGAALLRSGSTSIEMEVGLTRWVPDQGNIRNRLSEIEYMDAFANRHD